MNEPAPPPEAAHHGHVHALLDALPELAAILNTRRRAVFVNKALRTWLGNDRFDSLTGQRPGDLLACIHRGDNPEGCGEGEACRLCGANHAIQRALASGQAVSEDCRVSVERNGRTDSLDLRVGAFPFEHRRRRYLVVTITDISDQKRRHALERIFFHDVINTAGSLYGLIDLLNQIEDPVELRKLVLDATDIGKRLLEEIMAQKVLSQAENNELVPVPGAYRIDEIILEATRIVHHGNQSRKRNIAIVTGNLPSFRIETDRGLLVRVLVNMLKNAVEASPREGTVTVNALRTGPDSARIIRITVHNAGVMGPEVQLQLFQRSFSTKGSNRGLGTYSMKLLTERYLGGRITFVSTAESGTVFILELPAGN